MKAEKTERARFFIYSEPGQGHANEDAVQVHLHPGPGNTMLCALADGQGGQSGGDGLLTER